MPSFPHRATIELRYDNGEPSVGSEDARGSDDGTAVAHLIATSLRQEVGAIDDDRSETRLVRNGDAVTLEIRAADLTALRAASNTWLSLTSVAERVAGVA